MKGRSQGHMRAKPPIPDVDSDLEDGELPGEQLDDYVDPPRKQRKLTHGDAVPSNSKHHGGDGDSRPGPHASPPAAHQKGQREGGRQQRQEPSGASGKRKHQQQQPHHHQPQHQSPQQQPQRQHHQEQQHHKARGGGSGGAPSKASFASNKEALKARLESLVEGASVSGGAGGAPAAAEAAGKGRQQVAGASPAGGDAGGNKYRADIYKDARPSVEVKGGSDGGPLPHPIRLADVQALVLWVLSPAGNLVEAPRWAFVKNKPLVSGAVLVLASGLSTARMREKKHLLPFLSSLGRAATVQTSPQAKPVYSTAELLTTKVTLRNVKRKRGAAGEAGEAAGAEGEADAGQAGGGGAAGSSQRALDAKGKHQKQQLNGGGGSGGGGGGEGARGQGGGKGAQGSEGPPPPPPAGPRLPPGPFLPSHYVATLEQLRQYNYPLPSLDEGAVEEEGASRLVCPPGFVATRPSGDPTASERMVALDCEMCITEAGFELTRITLVAGPGWGPGTAAGAAAAAAAARRAAGHAAGSSAGGGASSSSGEDDGQGEGGGKDRVGGGGADEGEGGFPVGAVLMDELVVPDRPILDYNTRYSGITAKMLEGCANRLEDVRERFLSLVPAESLLVGHALENDLAALHICHGRLVDTALLFPHPKGPPFKSALKILARRFLRRTIQEGSHDSAVDARTALELALLKVKHGPSYGLSGSGPHASAPKLADVLSANCDIRCCLVDRHDVLTRHVTGATAAVPVDSDDDAVAAAGRQAATGTYGFVWTQLTEVSTFMFRRAKHKARMDAIKAVEAELAAVEVAQAAEAGAASTQGKSHAASATSTAVAASAVANGTSGKGTAAALAAAAVSRTPVHGTGRPGAIAAAAASATIATAAATAAASLAAAGAAVASGTPGAASGSGSGSAPDYSDAMLDKLLVSYDTRLHRLWEALPPRSLMVITTGAGDTAEYDRLYEQKCKRRAADTGLPRWTQADEEALVELGAREVQALCFAAVKGDGAGGASERA